MIDNFEAIVLFDKRPSLTAPGLETGMGELEPGAPLEVAAGAADDALTVKFDKVTLLVESRNGPMPEEAAIFSLGMADIPERDRQSLLMHNAHVVLSCSPDSAAAAIDKMIALLKAGMALCGSGGRALCIPASGLCLLTSELMALVDLDRAGPRPWGIDDAEAALANYESLSLWDSLRREAQPAHLLVGFIPAEIEGHTWFFSAGHSLFGLPEIVYCDGSLEDFRDIREYFQFLFPAIYKNPKTAQPGKAVPLDSALSFEFEELSPRYGDLQSTAGTLRVRLVQISPGDADWE